MRSVRLLLTAVAERTIVHCRLIVFYGESSNIRVDERFFLEVVQDCSQLSSIVSKNDSFDVMD